MNELIDFILRIVRYFFYAAFVYFMFVLALAYYIFKPQYDQLQLFFEQNRQRLDQKELICLADNIYYESVTESMKGKIAVATVTINRTQSSRYPNNICDVVYQRNPRGCQFSWVCQNRISDRRFNDPSWLEVKLLAHQILNGSVKTLPELENALYYHADYVNPFWNRHKEKITKIDTHIFYE
jgi:spore germination cell wall hydrolase CwlJ-like protein